MKNVLMTLTTLLLFSGAIFSPPPFAQETPEAEADQFPDEEAEEKIVSIDYDARRVSVSGFMNTRYLRAPSASLFIFREGYNAKRGLFISRGSPSELYEALITLGAIPAVVTPPEEDFQAPAPETEAYDDEEPTELSEHIEEGTQLKIFVTWEETPREYRLDEIVTPRPLKHYDIRFKGNMENSESVGSGDLLCLDNTEVGITGNVSIPKRRKNAPQAPFKVNKKLLPPNGHDLTVIFQLVQDADLEKNQVLPEESTDW